MRPILLAVVVFAAGTDLATAQQLSYTTRVEVRVVEVSPPPNPLLKQFVDRLGVGVRQSVLAEPGQPYEYTYVISERGLRADGTNDSMFMAAGSTAILAPDRTLLIVRPAEKSFTRLKPKGPPPTLDPNQSTLRIVRTSEFTEMAGVRVERATFENVFANPMRNLMEKLAGEPVVVAITGEAWIADSYKSYATHFVDRYPDAPFSFPLWHALHREGLVMRAIFRSSFFDGHELERTVIRVAEEPLDAARFEVPAGFQAAGFIEPPRPIFHAPASYTAEAARAKIDGEVVLEVTIAEDGSVRNPKVITSLGYGLDEEAIKSVLQWKYRPAQKDGVPVAVVSRINVRFIFRERQVAAP
jgi:TonB family protein